MSHISAFNKTLYNVPICEKYGFFYNNALEIIDSEDKNNKFLYLDALSNLSNCKNFPETKSKILKASKSAYSINSHEIVNEQREQLNKKGGFEIFKYFRESIFKPNRHALMSANCSLNSMAKSGKPNTNKSSLNSSFTHENSGNKSKMHCNFMKVTNPQKTIKNSNLLDHVKSTPIKKTLKLSAMQLSKIREKLKKVTQRIAEDNKNNKQISYNKSDLNNLYVNRIDKKNNIKKDKLTKSDLAHEIMFGKPGLGYHSKQNKINYQEILDNKELKFQRYIFNKYPVIKKTAERKKHIKLVGDVKILSVPKKYSENYSTINIDLDREMNFKNANPFKSIKDIYTLKKSIDLDRDSFFDNLCEKSEMKSQDLKEKGKFYTSLRKSFNFIENENKIIKNKIVNTRFKFQSQSMYVNPKFFVTMDSKFQKIESSELVKRLIK